MIAANDEQYYSCLKKEFLHMRNIVDMNFDKRVRLYIEQNKFEHLL